MSNFPAQGDDLIIEDHARFKRATDVFRENLRQFHPESYHDHWIVRCCEDIDTFLYRFPDALTRGAWLDARESFQRAIAENRAAAKEILRQFRDGETSR